MCLHDDIILWCGSTNSNYAEKYYSIRIIAKDYKICIYDCLKLYNNTWMKHQGWISIFENTPMLLEQSHDRQALTYKQFTMIQLYFLGSTYKVIKYNYIVSRSVYKRPKLVLYIRNVIILSYFVFRGHTTHLTRNIFN